MRTVQSNFRNLIITTVCVAILEGGVFGPLFFDETVNSERYFSHLKEIFLPKVLESGMKNQILFMKEIIFERHHIGSAGMSMARQYAPKPIDGTRIIQYALTTATPDLSS